MSDLKPLSELGQAALDYAYLRLRVIPLYPDTKRPMLDNWPQEASCEVDEVEAWWRANPDANIGCVTGEGSGIIVLDIDVKNPDRDGMETVGRWEDEHDQLPSTPVCITQSGGRHLYFRWVHDVETRHNLGAGVDLQVEGAQVVMPPSIVDGKKYQWADGRGLELLGAEPPDWLRQMQPEKPYEGYTVKSAGTYSHIQLYEPHCLGVRNEALFKFCSTIQGYGRHDEDQLREAAHCYNDGFCKPPLGGREVAGVIKSALKFERGDRYALENLKVAPVDENGEYKEPGIPGWQIWNTVYPPCLFIVQGMIPEGLSILSGPPKIGKSLCVMQLIGVCMEGGYFLGRRVERARVLYLALEDPQWRIKERMMKQRWPNADNVRFVLDEEFEERYGPLNQGGINLLLEDMERNQYDLVIIDTFTQAWNIEQNDVSETTHALKALQRHCNKHHTAVVVVDHDRKGGLSSDHILNIGGSRGKPATADTIISLSDKDRDTQIAKFQVTGREAEPLTMSLKFRSDDVQWEAVDGVDALKRNEQLLLDIIDEMNDAGKSTSAANIERAVKEREWPSGGKGRSSIFALVGELKRKGVLRNKVGGGVERDDGNGA